MTEKSNIIPLSAALSAPRSEMQGADDKAAVLETLANEINAANERAKKASKASLLHYRTVGEKLNAAKIAAGFGNFGAWAESKGFKREWRRHLMSLADNWPVLEPHLDGEWEGVGYSVKEACEIIDRHLGRGAASKADKQPVAAGEQQAPAHEKPEKAPAERACGNRSAASVSAHQPQGEAVADVGEPQPPKLRTLVDENLRLSAELKAAYEQVASLLWEKAKLEAQVADLKANEAKILSGGFLMEKANAATTHLPV